jgi:hypothetical protein
MDTGPEGILNAIMLAAFWIAVCTPIGCLLIWLEDRPVKSQKSPHH